MTKWWLVGVLFWGGGVVQAADAPPPPLTIQLVVEVPELQQWAEAGRDLMLEWYPRIVHLLPTKGGLAPKSITLRIKKSEEGVAYTAGSEVVVSSHWPLKHPGDSGLLVHELVHVVQGYPAYQPGWLVEGIADWLRWGIYERKPLEWFAVPPGEKGYERAYQVTAGFLLWLERDQAPGIVAQLHAALKARQYDAKLFEQRTGQTLDAVWTAYVAARKAT
ncbi:MAG: hypothetical protein IT204_20805 [Fimbriimonadaceae bacterium]|nr:hypothetical protein [Fimbriimonadaceae bacterium]